MSRVLIADDQRDVLEALRILLKGEGHQTESVTSVSGIFNALQQRDYALLSYEGKPGDYHLAYIDTLRRELDDVNKDFEQLLAKDLPALNQTLKGKSKDEIKAPPAKVAVNEEAPVSGGGFAGSNDPDEAGAAAQLPANFRLLY